MSRASRLRPLPAPEFPALEAWMRSKVARGLAPLTLEGYRKVVRSLLRDLRSAGRPLEPGCWTRADALRIRELLHGSHGSLVVVSDFSRAFGNNVVREVGIPPARPPTRVRWLTRAQVELIIRETRDEPLLAFVAFLGLAQGLRRIEWQRLLIEDIDLEGRRLLIRGKGRGRPRLQWVALHPSFAEVYGRYAEVRLHLVDAAGRDHPRAPVPAEVLVCATPSGLVRTPLAGWIV